MRRLLIGNFDFEWSLAHPAAPLPAHLARLSAELGTTWLAEATADDVLWLPGGAELNGSWLAGDGFCESTIERASDRLDTCSTGWPTHPPTVVPHLADIPVGAVPTPWGWTQRVIEDSRRAGLTVPAHPQVDVVRHVNSRRFSCELEREFGCEPPGALWLDSLDAVLAAIHRFAADHADDARWLLKADLSNSSRERLRGRGTELSARDRTWIESRLRTGGLAFEPWLEIVDEVGSQWDVPAEGPPRLIGVTPLLTDAAGHYRGSVFASSPIVDDDWSPAIETARCAAERIQSTGYFGPLGIDACRYRGSDGEVRLRPLQDINARWTMGRLALGWRRLLQPGEFGVWRFGPPDAVLRNPPTCLAHPLLRVMATSPAEVEGRPARIRHHVEFRSARR